MRPEKKYNEKKKAGIPMLKKEELSEMSNHDLLCELVYEQQQTRLYIMVLCAFCFIAAVALIVMLSSVSTALNSVNETLTGISKPMEDLIRTIGSLDVEAFNEAVQSLANTLAKLPFFGN